MNATVPALALVACIGLSSCAAADETGTLVHRVTVWESETHYSALLQAVDADVARVDHARGAGAKPREVAFDCVTLGQDANKDYLTLPTPDQQLSNDLSQAYAAYFSFGSDCVAHKGAPATVAALGHFLTEGDQALANARARSKAILG